jgi:ATP-dependent Clp protease ATP-binding subunit ClpB
MIYKKLTHKSHELLQLANDIAVKNGNQIIEPAHFFAAMIDDKKGVPAQILKQIGADITILENKNNDTIKTFPIVKSNSDVYPSKIMDEVYLKSKSIMTELKDDYISTEHFLIALTQVQCSVQNILLEQNVKKDAILKALLDIRGSNRVKDENPEDKYRALEQYGQNLNDLAVKRKLDPVIGRDEEVRLVMQVLSRRRKNNPVLIGEPGVGKTAIVEGIAQRIVQGDVPKSLADKTIIALDLSAILAGASYRGQFEDRLKSVVKTVIDSEGEIILFIDELHTLIGTGAMSGSLDAANILKPALARGELHCIGATTLDEYQKYIEKDSALERRFQKILVDEPSVESTISILRGIKEKYEVHHGVRIKDAAIIAAAELSDRYLTERFLPDKAIDLIDEAASNLRIQIDSVPVEIDEIQRKIIQLEIEKQALLKELDNG